MTPQNPGQPPFGSSPVTAPTPNRGQEAAALSRMAVIVSLIEQTLPMVGSGTEPGRDLIKALGILAKHVPQGGVPQGIQNSTLQKLLSQGQQQAPQLAALRAMQGGAGGAASPSPPAAPPAAA